MFGQEDLSQASSAASMVAGVVTGRTRGALVMGGIRTVASGIVDAVRDEEETTGKPKNQAKEEAIARAMKRKQIGQGFGGATAADANRAMGRLSRTSSTTASWLRRGSKAPSQLD